MDNELITKHKELNIIKDILKSGAKYPTVSIKETCSYEKGRLATQVTEEGVFPFVVTAKERKTAPEYQFDTKAVCIPLISSTGHGSATLNRIHYQEGKFALANLLFAVIPNLPDTELYPKFLYHILDARREELFCPLMKGTANVAMRMEDAVNVRFPLPDIEIQKQIVTQIEKQKAIIEGAEKIIKNWSIDIDSYKSVYTFSQKPISELILDSLYGSSEKANYQEDGYSVLRIGNIGFCDFKLNDIKKSVLTEKEFRKYQLRKEDFLIVRSNGNPNHVGKCAVWNFDLPFVYASYLIRFRFKTDEIEPKYVMSYLMSPNGRALLNPTAGGGTYNISATDFQKVQIPYPKLEEQRLIIAELDRQMDVLKGLTTLKVEAEKKIEKILADVWGVEYVETIENNNEPEEE